MRFDIERAVEVLDETLLNFFQKLINLVGVSNLILAQFFCFLGGGSTVSVLVWLIYENRISSPMIIYYGLFLAMYYGGIRMLLNMDTSKSQQMGNPIRLFFLYRISRVALILVLVGTVGDILAMLLNDQWRWVEFNNFLSFNSIVLALCFAACTLPPARRKRSHAYQNINVLL